MDINLYKIAGASEVATPALLYYRDYIIQNTQLAISLAGGPERLWPHVKTHKMAAMIRLQQAMGIARFKCATIAEAEMLARCEAEHILVAYPLVGPSVGRFLSLRARYPRSRFYAIGDDFGQLEALSAAAFKEGSRADTLLDINMGMDRTGVPLEGASALYRKAAALSGLRMQGLHGYDGHRNHPDLAKRREIARDATAAVHALRDELNGQGLPCPLLVMGGTPSFPIHAESRDVYLSPGTIFVSDVHYGVDLRDLPTTPGAAILTRVVSHPAPGLFTLDLGTKGISQDMEGRGLLLGVPGAKALGQSEEHWAYRMPEGEAPPPIGETLYVLPMHVCPTTALYPFAHVVEAGRIVNRWEVTARNRRLEV